MEEQRKFLKSAAEIDLRIASWIMDELSKGRTLKDVKDKMKRLVDEN